MGFTVSSKNNEQIFNDKKVVYISSKSGYDFQINTDFDFILGIQYDQNTNKCRLVNKYKYSQFKFKGEILPEKMIIDKVCKIMIDGSDDYITIKVGEPIQKAEPKQEKTNIHSDINSEKSQIESERVKIVKEVSSTVSNLKRKISINSKLGILLHLGMLISSFICAFGISNYLMGIPLSYDGTTVQIPMNAKLVVFYAFIVYSVGSMLKQGMFLYMQRKAGCDTSTPVLVEKLMIGLSLTFFVAIYLINLLYYISGKNMAFFAIFISLFYVGTVLTLALGCGYFKHGSSVARKELDKYEYREDFERVIKSYQTWIENFANSLSEARISKIKDKLLNLQIWSALETGLGILTAPFWAYGVSNTLAMCFPEAAGWMRIGGLRFSPIFLVLATFLIIFAFFSFVSAFTTMKKIGASDIIKQDGFSNYLSHGVEIYGLEGVKRLDAEMRRYIIVGLAIILIEFSMNISYFTQEIGSDMKGLFISCVAALVPTALLIAETIILSHTKFEIHASEELIARIDREE
ncbi:hypothetical protein IJ674_01190 [bacterium]|nr:hypothetical protein [bacterium]